MEKPIAYFITFTCYGTWIHGGKDVSVDPKNNAYNEPFLALHSKRHLHGKNRMRNNSYLMDEARREIVLRAIVKTCQYFEWDLLAVHVRSNHLHVVLCSDISANLVMGKLKAYASRSLNLAGIDEEGVKRWTRHGSTRYLWRTENVVAAISYVVTGQGLPMSVFVSERYCFEAGDLF